MRILLTNDDGIQARGIQILKDHLSAHHEVWVVAPDSEKSATSHSISLRSPLWAKQLGPREFSVSGTPVDSVFIALNYIFKDKPDLIISGINHGANMGEDVFYSGTVGAALEGAFRGVKSIAISCVDPRDDHYFLPILPFIDIIIPRFIHLKNAKIINVNYSGYPFEKLLGIRYTHLGKRYYKDELVHRYNEDGDLYFTIGGEGPFWDGDPEADFYTTQQGYVSITPLMLTLTDQKILQALKKETTHP